MTHPEARAFWDRYVPVLIEQGIATATDAPRLQMMAEAWALLRIATKALNKNPINKDTRIAYAEYSRQFAAAASEFGMTPVARSRIVIEKQAKPKIKGRSRD
ncbi:P27 family phage terminase small subunit [Rhodopirellula bahusiensis]|uniref:P27 family phage terminase small subunit n=1 Tax=Rhodopirellula bahusiensis TaxID=2014065 RepID=UPI0032669A72